MIKHNISTAIYLDTRRAKKDGTFPVKLRLTYERRQKYYGIGHSLTEEDFAKVMGQRPRDTYKALKLEFNSIEEKAISAINDLPVFSFAAFEKHFFTKRGDRNDVLSAFQAYIDQLRKEGRYGTATSYKNALSSLKKYHKRQRLPFDEITVDYLRQYEKWMLDQGRSITTVGIYLRSLRTMVNQAIQDGIIKSEFYPFGKGKYQIPSGRNIKKALTLEEVGKILNYAVKKGTTEEQARDYWLFIYFCSGINVKDMALLKYSNIEGDYIRFVREKTARTTRQNQKVISAYLNDQMKEIIQRWGSQPTEPDTYIFPILPKNVKPERIKPLVGQAGKIINKYMDRIRLDLGIEKKVTTYTARHTFSTVLKRSGASTELISESLGHNSLKTTESYLDSFEDDTKRKFAEALVPKGEEQ